MKTDVEKAFQTVNMTDVGNGTGVDVRVKEKSSFDFKEKAMQFFSAFHRYGLWITVFLIIGIYIGIGVSKTYYTKKMDESISVGGFLHKEIVYVIQKK